MTQPAHLWGQRQRQLLQLRHARSRVEDALILHVVFGKTFWERFLGFKQRSSAEVAVQEQQQYLQARDADAGMQPDELTTDLLHCIAALHMVFALELLGCCRRL